MRAGRDPIVVDAVTDEPADVTLDDTVDHTTDGHDDGSVDADGPDEADGPVESQLSMLARRLRNVHPAAWLTLGGIVGFTVIFGRLGVEHHRNFASWSFDMGIYDQAFWLVSRGGQSFMTVRGLEFWGHHVNLVVFLFVPFYWLGAGPEFLYVVQALVLGLGAMPVYLIARDRFERPWVGFAFAVAFLLYAPVQWISSANFHPEALVITPFLFAWLFAMRRSWRWFFVAVVLALSTREDAAMAVFVLGFVLLVRNRNSDEPGDRRVAYATMTLGAVWYLICTQLVIPYFNGGGQPYYVEYFYADYGTTTPEVVTAMLRHPDRVVRASTQPDTVRFFRDLLMPFGGLSLAAPLELLMAFPQLLASVTGSSPYARSIRYQYTAMMVAPIVISAIEGARRLWRFRVIRGFLVPWLLVSAYVTNVAWSPSPIGNHYGTWVKDNARRSSMEAAVELVPDSASVTATYTLLPHLSHRERIYDWPNPFEAAYWGNNDEERLPDPATIEYLVVDRQQIGPGQQELFDGLVDGDPFTVVFDRDDVLVARRG